MGLKWFLSGRCDVFMVFADDVEHQTLVAGRFTKILSIPTIRLTSRSSPPHTHGLATMDLAKLALPYSTIRGLRKAYMPSKTSDGDAPALFPSGSCSCRPTLFVLRRSLK